MTQHKTSLWAMVGLLLVLTALAARWLSADLLFVDEWWSIYKSGGGAYGPLSPSDIWYRLTVVDPGGMGAAYYYGLAGWSALVGGSPFAVRLFSLLLGVLAVAMTYRLGARLIQPQVGLYAAFFLAGSAFFIDFMHEARAYTMVICAVILAFYAYWDVLTRPTVRVWHYILLALALALVAYTHYVALAAIGAMGVYHLIFAPKNRRWVSILIAMGVGGLLYVPWLSVLLEVVTRGSVDTNRQATSMDAWRAVQQVAVGFSNNAIPLLALMLCAVVLIRTDKPTRLLWLWLVVGLGLVLGVNARTAFLVHPRYLIFLWPTLAMLCAIGLHGLNVGQKWYPTALLVIWVSFGGGLTLNPDFSRGMFGAIYRPPSAGLDQATHILRDVATEDDLTAFQITQPGYEPFALFIVDYLMLDVEGRSDQVGRMNNSFAEDDAGYLNDVLAALGETQRVYTVRVPELGETAKTRVTDYVLNQDYAHCGAVLMREDVTFNAYARLPDNARAFRDNAAYGFGDTSTGVVKMAVLSETIQPASHSAVILLGWGREAAFDAGQYSVSVQILDADGRLVAQHDSALPTTGRFGCTHAYFSLETLAVGEYRLVAAVYNRQTGARLPLENTAGDQLELATLRR